jgi:hypothetical protein
MNEHRNAMKREICKAAMNAAVAMAAMSCDGMRRKIHHSSFIIHNSVVLFDACYVS